MSSQLTGGRIAEIRVATSLLASPCKELFIRLRAVSSIAKKAKNILNATACETIPHCGMILASVRISFLGRAVSAIPGIILFASELRSVKLAGYRGSGSLKGRPDSNKRAIHRTAGLARHIPGISSPDRTFSSDLSRMASRIGPGKSYRNVAFAPSGSHVPDFLDHGE